MHYDKNRRRLGRHVSGFSFGFMSVVSGEKEGRKNLPVVVNNRAGRCASMQAKKVFHAFQRIFHVFHRVFHRHYPHFPQSFPHSRKKCAFTLRINCRNMGKRGQGGPLWSGQAKCAVISTQKSMHEEQSDRTERHRQRKNYAFSSGICTSRRPFSSSYRTCNFLPNRLP